ncbi:MAG: ASKHA domain-containing protein [Oscillospiraceae bacterium]
MLKASFPQWGLTAVLPEGATVAEAFAAVGHPLDLVCGGKGLCGKCLVEVTDHRGTQTVCACQTSLTDSMELRVVAERQVLRILDAHGDDLPPDYPPVCEPNLRYAAACDLGTTSVVLYLYDRKERRRLGSWSALNRQTALGADVVARLQGAMDGALRHTLQEKAVETIEGLLLEGTAACTLPSDCVSELVIAGNSAMEHLLLGHPVEQLARAPFRCHREDTVTCLGATLGFQLVPNAMVTCLPLIGGFVGGDTVAALLAENAARSEALTLLIDLGTNGELVLGNCRRRLAASAAAGPAMEGAGIVCGMRGAAGAIQRVAFTTDAVHLDVIGGGRARGICGSGLVDLLAELVRVKAVSPQGRLADADSFLAQGGAAHLAARLVDAAGQRAFVVAEGQTPVTLYQSDIRAMQVSKGAIAAAALLLLSAYGIPGTDLGEIQLAGAFGNYIDAKSACAIGLIPDFPGVPIRLVGNAAGKGAQQYLLSAEKRQEAAVLAAETAHLDLASLPDFTMTYAMCMALRPLSELDFEEF